MNALEKTVLEALLIPVIKGLKKDVKRLKEENSKLKEQNNKLLNKILEQ